jgi:hypothetical protein
MADSFRPLGSAPSGASDSFRPLQQDEAPPEAEAGPKESGESIVARAAKTAGGFSLPVAGSMAGTALGTAFPVLGPATPVVAESLLSAGGEALAQGLGWSEPSMTAIGAAALAGPAGRLVKPAWQGTKELGVKLFAGRDVVAEAAESLLKSWLNPAESAASLYARAQATRAMIPYGETARVVQDITQKEIGKFPLPVQREILNVLEPIEKFVTPTAQQGRKGFQMITQQPVANAMAEVRRLGLEAKRAFKAGNADLGQAISSVRVAVLDDLEKAGVPEVKAASRAYRKEVALENLSREIAKPTPGTKIRDFARKDPLFRGAFSPGEMEQIDRIAKKLTYVVPSGSSGLVGRMATTVGGEMLGGMGGGIAGFLGPEVIHNLIATPYGRGVTERILAGTFAPGPKEAAILASVARSLGGQALQHMKWDEEE